MLRGLGLICAVLMALLASAGVRAASGVNYPPVDPARRMSFPADYGAHPDYRTEWWYITGWLQDEQGVERGVQITFFRVRTGIGEDNPSRFAPAQLILAHAALADPAHGRLRHAERAARAIEPLAGARVGRTDVWIGDWRLERDEAVYRAHALAEDFALELDFQASAEPVLNGVAGFSRKARDPQHASHYYSLPQLAVSGSVVLDGARLQVSGRAWLDHEWSSGILPPEAVGWDWIGINLADGGSLMAFQMRNAQGEAVWRAGTLVERGGAPSALEAHELAFTAQRRWRSPRTGAQYPVAWSIDVRGRRLRVEPLMDDQELDGRASTGAIYWEGAVRLLDGERELGRGYLEMTGYAERLRM